MNLPLPEPVVKSAKRHENKNNNRQIDFEGCENEIDYAE